MATELSIQLGRKIRELRRRRHWRQIDLAAHAELSKTHICEIETGKRELGINALERLADALELKVSDLMKEIGR